MDYYSKREAKVMIMSALVEKGWKIYGYKADESDSMTDYFSPSDWDGIATKNGYTLLVDICKYHLSYSGKEVREYNYNNKRSVSNERIVKLTAMMNDAASTDNEKESCAVLIQKEQDKLGVEPEYTVIDTFPTFSFANPKGTSWHIEKDGQIIAKGNGAFAVNDYDWENKEKTEKQQKAEKLAALINRIEKALTDADALKPEIIKVPVTTVQIVEKEVSEITESDIKEGFTFVMKVGYTYGKRKGNKYTCMENGLFSKLGKNNKPSKSYDKMWSTSFSKLNEMLSKGHIAVIEFVEVTEYIEKTVFRKTARKQTVSNAPAIETPEVVTVNEETVTGETVEASNEVTMAINEEKNGIELTFAKKPSLVFIESLKENGFRWSSYSGKWWAKQTAERLAFAQSLVTPSHGVIDEEDTNTNTMVEEVTEASTGGQNDNVIYYEFSQTEGVTEEQKQEGDTMENNNTVNEHTDFNSFDDIFTKFDNIEISADQKISDEDLEFCKDQEAIYKQTIAAYDNLTEQLQAIKLQIIAHGEKYSEEVGTNSTKYPRRTSFDAGFSSYDLDGNITKIKDRFISIICHYFMNKYNITISNVEKIERKYDIKVTYENIIDEITIQLDGYNFVEKAEKEIKTKVIDIFKYNDKKIIIRNNKLILDGYFVRHDSIWKEYRLTNNKEFIFNALSHFDNGSVKMNKELLAKYCGYDNEKKVSNFEKYETQSLNKVTSIKFLKNGKMEIEFTSNQVAAKFANEYCGYNQKSA
ncbi:hypothetical protein [Paenibacillus donghaensis]|uniref:Uncharacterized protein n=1 Tax=Paenibacillus donghaensis TaxID=414771 RepID=A0A2Z2KHJ6_9BACL|nr:hypothetical protein [Paenibacillus donghaensis]ASA22733.1 hypothetical protein B9T62_19190 [Paenibacillus donghaensis]